MVEVQNFIILSRCVYLFPDCPILLTAVLTRGPCHTQYTYEPNHKMPPLDYQSKNKIKSSWIQKGTLNEFCIENPEILCRDSYYFLKLQKCR